MEFLSNNWMWFDKRCYTQDQTILWHYVPWLWWIQLWVMVICFVFPLMEKGLLFIFTKNSFKILSFFKKKLFFSAVESILLHAEQRTFRWTHWLLFFWKGYELEIYRHRPNSDLMGRFGFPWVPFRLNQKVREPSSN